MNVGIAGDWKSTALKAEIWVEKVTEGGWRFMATWKKEGVDAPRHRQEKREATRLGKLLSHTEALNFAKQLTIYIAYTKQGERFMELWFFMGLVTPPIHFGMILYVWNNHV